MPRKLLTICLFVSVGLNAQQVFYNLSEDLELDVPLPIDTTWCKAKAIDQVVVKRYYCRGKKMRKAYRFKQDVVFLLNDGRPNSACLHWDDNIVTAKIFRVYTKDLTYIDLKDAVYNPAGQWYKKVWVDTVTNRFFNYTKAYFEGGNIDEVVLVKGAMHPKGGVVHYTTYVNYNYNSAGLLTSITSWDKDETPEPMLNYRFDYKNNIVQTIYINLDPGYNTDTVYMGSVTYYSKGKKVKLK